MMKRKTGLFSVLIILIFKYNYSILHAFSTLYKNKIIPIFLKEILKAMLPSPQNNFHVYLFLPSPCPHACMFCIDTRYKLLYIQLFTYIVTTTALIYSLLSDYCVRVMFTNCLFQIHFCSSVDCKFLRKLCTSFFSVSQTLVLQMTSLFYKLFYIFRTRLNL